MSLTQLLYVLLASALSVALLAFGWMPCCCGNQSCCPGVVVPDTLTGTFTSSCSCLNGKTRSFVKSGTSWFASGDETWLGCSVFVNYDVTWELKCNEFTHQWGIVTTSSTSGLTSNESCEFSGAVWSSGSSTCSPLSLVFTGTMVTGFGYATCHCAGNSWTLTITP